MADHLYRSSLSSPDPRTNPSPVRHISDWTPPPPLLPSLTTDLCGLFVTVVYIQSALFVGMTLVHVGLCLGDCLWGRFFLCDLTPMVLINVRSSVTCTSLIYILWHVANLLLSFYLRLSLPVGINFSMWDFFFTWDCKFLSFYLDLSIIINYYTFLVITVNIFFFYAIY